MDTHQQWAELLRAISSRPPGSEPDAFLRQAVELGRDVAPDTVGCSVTTLQDDHYRTPVFSDEIALDLDRAQYQAGDGPCMAAAREQRYEYFDAITDGDRFPGFTEAAIGRGVRSSISLPLTGPDLPAAINIYASSRYAFDAERPRAVAGLLARCVSALMGPQDGARLVGDPSAAASRIEAAQARSRLIAAAQAVLMDQRSVSRTDALGLLIRRSRAEGRSIFDIAREVAGAGETGAAR